MSNSIDKGEKRKFYLLTTIHYKQYFKAYFIKKNKRKNKRKDKNVNKILHDTYR